MKDKIIQIIKGYECDAYFGANLNHLKESDYENVAEDIVKLFLIPPVIKSVCHKCKIEMEGAFYKGYKMCHICREWQAVL